MNSPNPSDKKNPPWRAVSQICGFDVQVACVASVSNRVRAGAKKKKNGTGKGREEEVTAFSPLPLSRHSFFCCRPNFLDELARKRLLRRLMCRVHWVRVDGRPIRIKKVCGFRSIRIPACGRGPVTQSVL